LITADTDSYVDIAVALANDLPRLAQLRGGLRERMKASPLMDAPRFTRNLERAFQEMWRTHLAPTK
jgi:predicted O-linked N-acetylglucosamine transferase (SPINDLY family)